MLLHAKKGGYVVFGQRCTNHTDFSDDGGRAVTDVVFTGYIVKMNPLAFFTFDNTFCAENHTAMFSIFVKGAQDSVNIFC